MDFFFCNTYSGTESNFLANAYIRNQSTILDTNTDHKAKDSFVEYCSACVFCSF